MNFLWIVLLAGGLTLLITGTLPIGRFPNFASEVSIMRALMAAFWERRSCSISPF